MVPYAVVPIPIRLKRFKLTNSDMNCFNKLDPQTLPDFVPQGFHNPFSDRPAPIAELAAKSLQKKLDQNTRQFKSLFSNHEGKMFGVLVVKNTVGEFGYLAGYSGMLNQQWATPGFVPPVFDLDEQVDFLRVGEARLLEISNLIKNRLDNPARLEAIQQLSELKQRCEHDLSAIRCRNKKNKKLRWTRRKSISSDHEGVRLLHELSLSSQQDKKEFKRLKLSWREILLGAEKLFEQNYGSEINRLRSESKQLSQKLHSRVFETYRLQNSLGEVASVKSLFDGKAPPGGTGDCAAPKLLQFALTNNFKPLALAEFWWGDGPSDGIRHHGEFYSPCRGKCHPVLPFLIKGLEIESDTSSVIDSLQQPDIVYEDEYMVAINKPVGLLSIPGKQITHSVSNWLAERYPKATGPLLVHRLDMATSGLLLATKDSYSHKQLQKQFIERKVEKRYLAVLSKPVVSASRRIRLPLRVDFDDRPRQMVCYEHGKKAETRVEIISKTADSTRVYLYPVTGRTHQLRVHAAHHKGLAAPIVGDELYGTRAERLMLHAESINFCHPHTGRRMSLTVDAAF